MSDGTINITHAQLQKLLEAAVAAGNKLNPLEQKEYDQKLADEKRKNEYLREMGRIQAEADERKKDACSHTKDAEGAPVRKGTPGSTWTTSGQLSGEYGVLVCLRCSRTWRWQVSRAEAEAINQAPHGLLNAAPPDASRCIEV